MGRTIRVGELPPTRAFSAREQKQTGRKTDGGWTFFSIKEQSQTEGLLGIATFFSVIWS